MKVLVFLCLVAFAVAVRLDNRANSRADEFLNTIKTKYADKVDPYQLEDVKVTFDDRIGLVDIKFDIDAYNGKLTGLQSMKRVDEASSKQGYDYIDYAVEADNLRGYYDIKMKLPLMNELNYNVEATVEKVVARHQVLFMNGKPKLVGYEIIELKGVSVHHHNGPIDMIADILVNSIIKANQDLIQRGVEAEVAYQIRQFYESVKELN